MLSIIEKCKICNDKGKEVKGNFIIEKNNKIIVLCKEHYLEFQNE